MKEITLNTETIKIPSETSYTVDDMERMFGKRIRKAIYCETNKNKRTYKGIIAKKMAKIIKPWKFWNADIRKAYKNYVGMIIVPWIIRYEEPEVIICDEALKNKYLDKAIVKELHGLPPIKLHCSVLGMGALRAAIKDYLKKKK